MNRRQFLSRLAGLAGIGCAAGALSKQLEGVKIRHLPEPYILTFTDSPLPSQIVHVVFKEEFTAFQECIRLAEKRGKLKPVNEYVDERGFWVHEDIIGKMMEIKA